MSRTRNISAVVCVLGVVGAVIGGVLDLDRTLQGWLFAWHVFAGISLGSLSFMMLYDVTDGRWGWPTRPLFGAAARIMPWMALLFVVPMMGVSHLYAWARPFDSDLLRHKAAYLNVPFWMGRTIAYLALMSWGGVAFSRRMSPAGKSEGPSAPGLVVYILTVSFASIDWVMSLEPEYYSTVYGLCWVIGDAVAAMAFIIVVVALLTRDRGTYAPIQYYALGGLLVAFIMMLAYMEFSQWVIIWSGNKPDEISWYLHRIDHGWCWPGLAVLVLGLFGPFVSLLFASNKRRPERLLGIAGWVLALMVVHYYWWVIPAVRPRAFLAWQDVACFLAIGGLWLAVYIRNVETLPANVRSLICGSAVPAAPSPHALAKEAGR